MFIDPKTTGVAYWAGTIFLIRDEASFHPRMQSLNVPESTALIAVVRIDNAHGGRLSLSSAQRATVVQQLVTIASRPGIRALQIDYDATASERQFYRQLLADLRRLLPKDLPLSITALASWCLGDPWIKDLPIDEAIPMLFSMGRDDELIREQLSGHADFSVASCRSSLGLSVDEPITGTPAGRRRYFFSRQRWNAYGMQAVTDTPEKRDAAGLARIATSLRTGHDFPNLEERK